MRLMKLIKIIILALIIGNISIPMGIAGERLHLNINCTIHSPYESFFFRLIEEICSRNNISVQRNTPPVGRSLIHANQGIDDGDGPRIEGLESAYPDLIRIPEPFGDFIFGAFTRDKGIRIDGWPSLSKLNIAYINGWKIFETQAIAAKSITKVNDQEILFRLLDAGRADAVLITELAGYAVIRNLGLKGIRFVTPALAVKPNYLYLHKRHKGLVPIMTQTLKQIKQDGTYERLHNEIILPFLPENK